MLQLKIQPLLVILLRQLSHLEPESRMKFGEFVFFRHGVTSAGMGKQRTRFIKHCAARRLNDLGRRVYQHIFSMFKAHPDLTGNSRAVSSWLTIEMGAILCGRCSLEADCRQSFGPGRTASCKECKSQGLGL